jgi:hypothetical protein
VVVHADGRGHRGIVHWNQGGGHASLLSGRGDILSGCSGNRFSGIVEEMAWSHAVVLGVITLAIIVLDTVVNAELRTVVDATAGILDLQVIDALFEISLGIPGE